MKSVDVAESLFSAPAGSTGGVISSYYEEPEEVKEWKQKLLPYDLDIQPLLYPLDHSKDIRIEVEDTATNSILHVSCVLVPDV